MTASTSPPTTCSSPSMPWRTRIPAASTPEPSSTRSSRGALIDDDTFEVVAKEPLFTFLYDIRRLHHAQAHLGERPFAEWRNDPGATGTDPSRVIGSGPWKFQEWRQGESVTLVRNDDYYGKVPYLDTYVLRIWPDQTAVVNALLNGEIDAAELEPSDVAAVEGTPGIAVAHYPTRGFTFYEFNLDPEVTTKWQDQRVRQAMFYALDRESIVNDILLGYAEVAQGTQPVVSYAYAPDQHHHQVHLRSGEGQGAAGRGRLDRHRRRRHRRQGRRSALLRIALYLRLAD